MALRVLVCAAQPAVRAGLRDLLTRAGFDVTGELSLDALGGSPAPAPLEAADVLVADIGDPGPDADLLARLRSELADFPVVLLVDGPEAARVDDVSDVSRVSGVSDVGGDGMAPRGWLLREAAEDELAAAVRAVAAGMVVLDPSIARRALAPGLRVTSDALAPELRLTAREGEVMRLLALGLPNKAIAIELGISEHTVKFHVGAMLSKLGARSRTEAVTIAARRGLLAL